MSPAKVEVLYFDGCPNHGALLPRLRELLASAACTLTSSWSESRMPTPQNASSSLVADRPRR